MNIATGARGNGMTDIATGGGATHGTLPSFSFWWGDDKPGLSTLHLFTAGASGLHGWPRNVPVKRAVSRILPCEDSVAGMVARSFRRGSPASRSSRRGAGPADAWAAG